MEEREAPNPLDEEVEGHQLGGGGDEKLQTDPDEDVEGHAYDPEHGRAAWDAENTELGATDVGDQ